ncbi:MAG: family 16 glycosylhydrolase [Paludibacter sp.]|nr:family 16 glycosylhydrolase [Paludibacter sp.]
MKKILMILLSLSTLFAFSQTGQIQLLDDFENGDKGWQPVDAGWVDFEIVNNPAPNSVNNSAKVLKVTRHAGTQTYAGVILRNYMSLTFGSQVNQYRYAKIKFLKSSAGQVTLKLEINGDAGSSSANGDYTTPNAWQEVTFDLSGASGKTYDDFFIQPAKDANLTSDVTVYIDDICFAPDPNPIQAGDNELSGDFTLIWADEFDGASYDNTIWSPQIAGDGFGNNELQYYTGNSNNIFTRDGCLVLKAIRENYGGRQYTSGKIWTQNKKYFKYGRVEARFKLPAGRGTWPAIWMMPQSSVYGGWPNSGEIDIMEFVGYQPNIIFGTVHRGAGSGNNGNGSNIAMSNPNAFHIVRIDWEPGYIKWYLDGTLFHTYNNAWAGSAQWPFDQNFYVILNFAVGGDWGGAQGVDTNIWPQEFLIDYVRVYQKIPTSAENMQVGCKFKIVNFENTITVSSDKQIPFDIVVFSLTGQKLLEQNGNKNTVNIDISALNDNVYIVQVSDSLGSYSQKILK